MDIPLVQGIGAWPAAAGASTETHPPPAQREVVQAVKSVNESGALGNDRELSFQQDRDSGRRIIRVLDRQTGEVITQVPPEVVLRLAKYMAGQR